jgi:hypothetical protein
LKQEKETRLDAFFQLSVALAAHELSVHLAETYLERVREATGAHLDMLLDLFQTRLKAGDDPVKIVKDTLLPDPKLGPVARTILLLWYIGGIQNPASGDWELTSADHYYRALVWQAIGAHPPTLSNGYFGHWKYPPEM